jgi:ribosomal protein S18 acetylase RimI-like enzyme
MRELFRKIRNKGFIGPHYAGWSGKARFLAESLVGRDELILAVEPSTLIRPTVNRAGSAPGLELHHIRSFADFLPYSEAFDRAYYRGYIQRWKAPFTWGERAVIGTVDGQLACYNWVQEGTPQGFPTYYGPIFGDEARVLRAGVLPAFRNAGLNRQMKLAILSELFELGVRRVFAETYLHNLPSLRSLLPSVFAP